MCSCYSDPYSYRKASKMMSCEKKVWRKTILLVIWNDWKALLPFILTEKCVLRTLSMRCNKRRKSNENQKFTGMSEACLAFACWSRVWILICIYFLFCELMHAQNKRRHYHNWFLFANHYYCYVYIHIDFSSSFIQSAEQQTVVYWRCCDFFGWLKQLYTVLHYDKQMSFLSSCYVTIGRWHDDGC